MRTPGLLLARAGRALLSPDRYARVLAPAIADLQHEAAVAGPRRSPHVVRAYGAVLVTFAGALRMDAGADMRRGFVGFLQPRALGAAGVAMLLIVAGEGLLVYSQLPADSGRIVVTLLGLMLPALVTVAVPSALLVAAARSGRAPRQVAYASVVIAALLFVAVDQGVTRTNQQFREIAYRVVTSRSAPSQPGPNELPVRDLVRMARADGRTQWMVSAYNRLAVAAACIPMALLGAALAGASLWMVTAAGIAMFLALLTLFFGAAPLVLSRTLPPVFIAILMVAPMLALAAAAHAFRRRREARRAG